MPALVIENPLLVFNRNTLKISCSCMPKIGQVIKNHNKSILDQNEPELLKKRCNCREKTACPLENKCLTEYVVYRAQVTSGNETSTYIGLTEGTFKKRYTCHKSSFSNEKLRLSSELSKKNLVPEGRWQAIQYHMGYCTKRAIGSAEDLPPRFRANPPNFRQKYFPADSAERPANVRRTPPDSARKRANPRGVRRELAEEFTRKMFADKNLSYATVPGGRSSVPDDPPPRTIPPRTCPPRTIPRTCTWYCTTTRSIAQISTKSSER